MTEPRTQAGRTLLATGMVGDYAGWVENSYEDTQDAILAIEAEAFNNGIRFVKEGDARAAVDWPGTSVAADLFRRLAFWPGHDEPPCWCDGIPDHDEPHDAVCEDIRRFLAVPPRAEPITGFGIQEVRTGW